MSERVAEKIGAPAIVAITFAVVLAYSLWGAAVLSAERQQASASTPAAATSDTKDTLTTNS